MILTSPSLAPTLLRAGFLYDNFPSDAVVSNDLLGRDDYVGAKKFKRTSEIAEERHEKKMAHPEQK